MLGITFMVPAILGASAVVAAPVVIHLILRSKPRRVVFPALRFVRKTHRASVSVYRLKHLLLLLMRMLAIVLLAVLIAHPLIAGRAKVADTSPPVDAVMILDNSASMGYRYRNLTLLRRSKRLATRVLRSLPANSRVAVLSTASSGGGSFLVDRGFIAQQIADVALTAGDASVAPATARAAAMLKDRQGVGREVYLFTDMTRQGFRDAPGVGDVEGVGFTIVNVSSGEDANVALGSLRLSESAVPSGRDVTVETTVVGGALGGQMRLLAELDGRVEYRKTVRVRSGSAASVSLSVRPRAEGVLAGRVVLKHADPLDVDNVRYFTIHVAAPAKMLVVSDAASAGRTAHLMGLATAPPGGEAQAWLRREPLRADRLEAERLADAQIVMLANVSRLSAEQWSALERFARDGGGVWVVAGSLMNPADYNSLAAQRVMPAVLKGLEELPVPMGFETISLSHPMLQPFLGEKSWPLSKVRCRRRFGIEAPAADSHVVLKYADGTPAIVVRKIGEGSALFWNFSPLPEASNISRRDRRAGGPFPILALHAAQMLARADESQTMYFWGQSVTIAAPSRLRLASATVAKPGQAVPTPLPTDPGGRSVTVLADRLGHWKVSFTEAGRSVVRGFSVNARSEESDLTPIAEDELRRQFPEGLVIASDFDEIVASRQPAIAGPTDLAVPLLLVLLALLTCESFFANRFYRKAQQVNEED